MGRSIVLGLIASGAMAVSAQGQLFTFTDVSGLSAEAEFSLINPTTVEIRLQNTSTGVPMGFTSADQLLTAVSWDAGMPGLNVGDPMITGGSVVIGPTSMSLNFDTGSYGAGTDVSGEWGYGNMDGTGLLWNMVSTVTAGTMMFPGANLDGPVGTDGPQAGLVADPILVSLGGLGAVQDEIIITVTLDQAIANLGILTDNGVRIEFGSDAFFIPTPASVLVLGVLGLARRRR